MMSKAQPAYPQGQQWRDGSGYLNSRSALHTGKTMLDSFAEAALTGLLHRHAEAYGSHDLVVWAYDIAEEMLAEKKKREAK